MIVTSSHVNDVPVTRANHAIRGRDCKLRCLYVRLEKIVFEGVACPKLNTIAMNLAATKIIKIIIT